MTELIKAKYAHYDRRDNNKIVILKELPNHWVGSTLLMNVEIIIDELGAVLKGTTRTQYQTGYGFWLNDRLPEDMPMKKYIKYGYLKLFDKRKGIKTPYVIEWSTYYYEVGQRPKDEEPFEVLMSNYTIIK